MLESLPKGETLYVSKLITCRRIFQWIMNWVFHIDIKSHIDLGSSLFLRSFLKIRHLRLIHGFWKWHKPIKIFTGFDNNVTQHLGLLYQPQSQSLSSGLWTLNSGLRFGTWIWDLDLGLGFGLHKQRRVIGTLSLYFFMAVLDSWK